MQSDLPTTESETTTTRRPRRLRALGAIVASVVAVSVLAGCISTDQSTVQSQINGARATAGVGPLADYGAADSKAQAWAEHLAAVGSLSHSNLPSGYPAGSWCRLGENVGMGPSLPVIHLAFMQSPPHRANILNSAYNRMGTGVAKRGNTYFVVEEFVTSC